MHMPVQMACASFALSENGWYCFKLEFDKLTFLVWCVMQQLNTARRLTNKTAFFWHSNGTLAHDEFKILASLGGKQMCPFILNILEQRRNSELTKKNQSQELRRLRGDGQSAGSILNVIGWRHTVVYGLLKLAFILSVILGSPWFSLGNNWCFWKQTEKPYCENYWQYFRKKMMKVGHFL